MAELSDVLGHMHIQRLQKKKETINHLIDKIFKILGTC